jgi:hypothetical protein
MAPFTIVRTDSRLHLSRRWVLGLIRVAAAFSLGAICPIVFLTFVVQWRLPAPFGPLHWSLWVFLLMPFLVLLANPLFDLTTIGRGGEFFVFDLTNDQLIRNRRRVISLRSVLCVRVAKTGYKHPRLCVTLNLRNSPPFTISDDSASLVWLADGRTLARTIGKFLNVPVEEEQG